MVTRVAAERESHVVRDPTARPGKRSSRARPVIRGNTDGPVTPTWKAPCPPRAGRHARTRPDGGQQLRASATRTTAKAAGSYCRMLIARAITSPPIPRDATDSVIISSLGHRLIAEMSVGLNAVAVQKASTR